MKWEETFIKGIGIILLVVISLIIIISIKVELTQPCLEGKHYTYESTSCRMVGYSTHCSSTTKQGFTCTKRMDKLSFEETLEYWKK